MLHLLQVLALKLRQSLRHPDRAQMCHHLHQLRLTARQIHHRMTQQQAQRTWLCVWPLCCSCSGVTA